MRGFFIICANCGRARSRLILDEEELVKTVKEIRELRSVCRSCGGSEILLLQANVQNVDEKLASISTAKKGVGATK